MAVFREQPDPNERFRQRRRLAQQRKRRRRAAVVALALAAIAAVTLGARYSFMDAGGETTSGSGQLSKRTPPPPPQPRALPGEMRGVHVTMALASLDGKLEEYLDLQREGLNTIELDVKDENGEIGFVPSAVPLARAIGAAKPYYKPRQVARQIHARGLYLIGRVVVFEDPVLSEKRSEFAIRTRDGSIWRNSAGLGWTNPYDRRVWEYNVDIAAAAARAGFDEIQFDYVRFPSDGDMENIVYPGKTDVPPGWVIPQFLQYAAKRLRPLGVRISADVFGLSATRDLGIGQFPRRIANHVDVIYPMVYPSHYGPGEYNIDDPNGTPRATVAASLEDFRLALRGRRAKVIPWLQDFSLGRTYTLTEVREQINAARAAGAAGYLLWSPLGVYTDGALTAP